MLNMLPQLVILFFSIIFHEVAHGWVALWRGDTTARDYGRLTFNPIPHIDPIGSVLLPVFLFLTRSPILFGWAKPVPVNPWRLRQAKKDLALVSASGPVSNLLLAVVFSVLFRVVLATDGAGLLAKLMVYGVVINLVLAFFNLLPVPPLDGSKIVLHFLPDAMAEKYIRLERFGFIIIFLLLMLNVVDWFVWPFVLQGLQLLVGRDGLVLLVD